MNMHYKYTTVNVYVIVRRSTNMQYELCDKVHIQVEFQKKASQQTGSFVQKLQGGRDKLMTTTFITDAILGECNSVTKPCELDFVLTHQGCCCKTPNRAGAVP